MIFFENVPKCWMVAKLILQLPRLWLVAKVSNKAKREKGAKN